MADSHSFSLNQVWFKPVDNLQINVGESVLSVCVPPIGYSILTGGTAGVIKVWDVLSGKLQVNIRVGCVILKMIWISLKDARTALVVGLDDGSILLYWYWAPSRLSKFQNFALGLLPFSFTFDTSRFTCAMKVVLPGAIEDLNSRDGMIVAVGGDQLKLFSLDRQSVGLRRTHYGLREHFHVSPHKLIALIAPSLNLRDKRIHSVNFTSDNLLVVSFVDASPVGQNSILALLQINPWKLVKAVEVNRRVGALSVSPAGEKLAFTNLADGLNIFSLPTLSQMGAITEKLEPSWNFLIGLDFLDDKHVVGGGYGSIRLYDTDSLRIVSTFLGQEVACIYRCVSCSSKRHIILGGSDDGWLCAWGWEEMRYKAAPWFKLSLPSQVMLCAFLVLVLALYVPLVLLYIKLYSLR